MAQQSGSDSFLWPRSAGHQRERVSGYWVWCCDSRNGPRSFSDLCQCHWRRILIPASDRHSIAPPCLLPVLTHPLYHREGSVVGVGAASINFTGVEGRREFFHKKRGKFPAGRLQPESIPLMSPEWHKGNRSQERIWPSALA